MKNHSEIETLFARGVRVLNSDPSGLIALCKFPGILSHPNRAGGSNRALLPWPYDFEEECYRSPEGSEKVWLLNRLDSATSGVLLISLEKETAILVKRLLAEGKVNKKYYALVFGAANRGIQQWRDRLSVTKTEGRLRTSVSEGGVMAETVARTRKVFPGTPPVTLLELEPRTGRTHQLRVQCARHKLPIVGDQTYGQFRWNREFARKAGTKRLFLHSAEIAFSTKWGRRRFSFVSRAPLPKEFDQR